MKVIVQESFEQGLPRQNGGVLKLTAGTYEATSSEHGLSLSIGGKNRSIPADVVKRLADLKLIRVE